jgi:hypothetical protein
MNVPHPRTWPWWIWVLLLVAVLVSILLSGALVIRSQGQRELRLVIDDLHARGLPVLPADLVARAPTVDAGRQARAWALFGGGGSWTEANVNTYGLQAIADSARRKKDGKIDDRIASESARIIAASATARAEWRRLWQEGPVVLSAFGWLRAHLPDPEQAGFASMAATPIPSLLQVRYLASALATEARLAADPAPALADLDALVAAHQPSGSLIDAMIAIAIAAIRDDAWLEAVARGGEPRPWLTQNWDPMRHVADALAAERVFYAGGYVQDLRRGSLTLYSLFGLSSSFSGGGRWESVSFLGQLFVLGPHDAAFMLRELAVGETLARTGQSAAGGTVESRLRAQGWRVPVSRILMPNTLESVYTAAGSEFRGRMLRIAEGIVWNFRSTGTVPADAAHLPDLVAPLAAATAWSPALRYTRLSATRFRLDCDPATPPTEVIPAGRIEAWKPASSSFLVRHWGLEWDLAPQP